MVTLSSRFLALLVMAVVAVSLLGSLLGYAAGVNSQRTSVTEVVAGTPATPQTVQNTSEQDEPPAVPSELASAGPPKPAVSAPFQRIPDSVKTEGLSLGATAAKDGVAVTLTDAQVNVWEHGLELRLTVTNTSGRDLPLVLTPERDLVLEDNRGVHWNLRWAEYEGEVTVQNGEKRQLVRALYHGEMQHPNVDHLTLTLRDVPRLMTASWSVPVPRGPEVSRP